MQEVQMEERNGTPIMGGRPQDGSPHRTSVQKDICMQSDYVTAKQGKGTDFSSWYHLSYAIQ